MEASCLDSHADTITQLRNRQLEGEKKIMFLCSSLAKSQYHIIEAYAKDQANFHHILPVHGILCIDRYDTTSDFNDSMSARAALYLVGWCKNVSMFRSWIPCSLLSWVRLEDPCEM